jgi:hypothetical protein
MALAFVEALRLRRYYGCNVVMIKSTVGTAKEREATMCCKTNIVINFSWLCYF